MSIDSGLTILEIGGGAHPSIKNREGISYTIVDPDLNELEKAPSDIIKINNLVQNLPIDKKYDLIISKMVLEHVEDPDSFHTKVLQLLNDDGRAVHFFACRHSVPALVNRLLPELLGDLILRLLKNRDMTDEPKYKAYYRRTFGHTKDQLSFFESIGFQIKNYHSFVGHKYFQNIPILSSLEKHYTRYLVKKNLCKYATVALVELKKTGGN